MYKVSVAIPTSNYYGMGVKMLDDLLYSISIQSFDSIQVVISDHSTNNDTEEYCFNSPYNLNIKYVRNNQNIGNPGSNHNNAIENSDGEIIKLMQQDDFFYDNNALSNIYNALNNSESKWLVCGCVHTYDDGLSFTRPMHPEWNPLMLYYPNSNNIGGVSVLAIKNDIDLRFDENVRMLLDIDYYFNLRNKYGEPVYLNNLSICSRVRENNRLSAEVSREEEEEEYKYCHKKYNIFL